jgi:small-conductance mechanosensitive channel
MVRMISTLLAATPTQTGVAGDVVAGVKSFWDMWGTAITIAAIIVGAVVVRVIALFVIRRVVDQIVSGVKRKQQVDDTQALVASPLQAVRVVQRTRTLGSVLQNVVTVVVVIIALTTILGELKVNTIGIVSAASVIAAGLAFGAQSIVKDMLSGLFIIAEDQLGVGDVVDVGLATGMVESVGIRVTQVRDVNGTLWFVPNGQILRVGNMSQGWARVVLDTAVPYDVDIDEVEAAMLQTATALAVEPRWKTRIVEKPELWGLESISESALVIRLVVRTRSAEKDNVARELRTRIKKAMDQLDITLPSLTSVVLTGFDEATSVRGARPVETAPTPVKRPGKTTRKAAGAANTPPAPGAAPATSRVTTRAAARASTPGEPGNAGEPAADSSAPAAPRGAAAAVDPATPPATARQDPRSVPQVDPADVDSAEERAERAGRAINVPPPGAPGPKPPRSSRQTRTAASDSQPTDGQPSGTRGATDAGTTGDAAPRGGEGE